MTILGQHTIAETNALMADVDHRFTVDDKAMSDALVANQAEAAKLKPFWDRLVARWSKDKLAVKAKMGVIRVAFPLVNDDKVPSDNEYKQILGYVETDTGDPNLHPNDSIRGLELQIQSIIGHPIDIDTGRPSLDPGNVTNDPDLNFINNPTVTAAAGAGQGISDIASAAGKALASPTDHTIRNVGIGAAVGAVVLVLIKVLIL
jgi:hypothetical protein